jgi:hypothetical protein
MAGSRHERGLGTVVPQGLDGEIRLGGGDESVLGVEVGANDLGGEFSLGVVRWSERDWAAMARSSRTARASGVSGDGGGR